MQPLNLCYDVIFLSKEPLKSLYYIWQVLLGLCHATERSKLHASVHTLNRKMCLSSYTCVTIVNSSCTPCDLQLLNSVLASSHKDIDGPNSHMVGFHHLLMSLNRSFFHNNGFVLCIVPCSVISLCLPCTMNYEQNMELYKCSSHTEKNTAHPHSVIFNWLTYLGVTPSWPHPLEVLHARCPSFCIVSIIKRLN